MRPPSSVKLKCLNLSPQVWETGTNGTASSNYARFWTEFKWTAWIKPQIDLAISVGANAVKIAVCGIGSLEAASGDHWPTNPTLFNEITQVLNYCIANKLAVYLVTGGAPDYFGNPDLSTRIANLTVIHQFLETFPNCPVVGCDLINEVNFGAPSSWSNMANLTADINSLVVAARAGSTIPLTASVYLNGPGDWTGNLMQAVAAAGVDFHDGHTYYSSNQPSFAGIIPAISDVNNLVTQSWFKGSFMQGEQGVGQDMTPTNQATMIAGWGALSQHPLCWGGNYFLSADYAYTGDGWGGFPGTEFGLLDHNLANLRTTTANAFTANWPGLL